MPALLVLAFLAVPVLEIYVIVQVGQVIGTWPTLALLVLESLLGAWLVRREGRRTWAALQSALNGLRVPSRELLDGALVLVGGTLLLTPGFLTDVLGFALVLPFTRPVLRRLVARVLASRVQRRVARMGTRSGRFGAGSTIPGEVLRPEDPSR